MKKDDKTSAGYIAPLIINGLRGRVLNLPSTKKKAGREILLVYGHHSSLERMYGIAESMTKYGKVTMPDLPGFGGMDSLYKIGEKPTLDKFADYLATFIRLKYKNRPITIGAMSFGFVIVTKMLQKYPELVKQVDLLISLVGFSSCSDFKFKKSTFWTFKTCSAIFSGWLPAGLLKLFILRGPLIRLTYLTISRGNYKMRDADKMERRKRIDFEIKLWQSNDIRTYMYTTQVMMHLNLTKQKINLPLKHIAVNNDQYFDNASVRRNFSKIFKKVKIYKSKMPAHAPTVISRAEEVDMFITKEIKRELAGLRPV